MSGAAQGKVYTMAVSGSDMLVLLAYADYADDYGKNMYPAFDSIAYRVSMSRRQVQRIVKKYLDLGWLKIIGKTSQGINRIEFDYDACQYKPTFEDWKASQNEPKTEMSHVTSRCHGGDDTQMSWGCDIQMSPNPSLTVIKPIAANAANVSISDSTKPEPENPITRTDEMATHGNSHEIFFIPQRSPAENLVRSWQLPPHLEDLSLEFVRMTGVMPRGGTKRSDKGMYAADAKDWLDAKFTVEDMQEAYQRCNGKFPITHLGALFRNVQENKRHTQPKVDNDDSANMVYIPGGQRVRAQ